MLRFFAVGARTSTPCLRTQPPSLPLLSRFMSYEPYEASFDPDDLSEARQWQQNFQEDSIPKGNTTFSRSSGPGGQHVNKTETKATTTWPVGQLMPMLPKLLRSQIRSSKFYSQRNDSISIQAQTQRSRTANVEENHQKLFDELQRMYKDTVPGETSSEKVAKYDALKKTSNETRIKSKKHQSSKKSARKGGGNADY